MSAGLLVVALLVTQFRSSGEAVPIRKSLDAFPTELGGFKGQEATVFDVETLDLLKVKDYLVRRYVGPDRQSLWLYVGYWDTQRKGAQIHSPKNCLPGAGWEPLEASRLTVPLPARRSQIVVNRYLVQKDREQQLVVYWYQAQGRAIAGEIAARVDLIKRAALQNRTEGALIRISTPVTGSVQDASDRLVHYIQTLVPVLDEYLPV